MAAVERLRLRSSTRTLRVEAEAVRIGADLLVFIWGGTRPHIGAVAAAQPRPSLADPAKTSATSSVLTYPGHKEDVVVKQAAEALVAALNTNVVVAAGVHWDGLDRRRLGTVIMHCREVTDKLIRRLKQAERRR